MRELRPWLAFVVLCVGCGAEGTLRLDLHGLEEGSARVAEVYVLRAASQGAEEALCTQLVSASIDVDAGGLTIEQQMAFRLSHPSPELGHVEPGRALFFARVRDSDCVVIGAACEVREVTAGQDLSIGLVVEPPSVLSSCAPGFVCDDGVCSPCSETTNDADGDGHCPDECGGGCDDCDDGNANVHGGAARRCGAAIDHDCDGVVDDLQECGPCAPTGTAVLRYLNTLPYDARRGLFVVGPDPDEAPPMRQLYAVSSKTITSCSIGENGAAIECDISDHGAERPLPPVVVGEHLLLLDNGGSYDLKVFARGDLAAGPIASVAEWGMPSSMLLDRDSLYIAAVEKALWSVDVSRLPRVERPESPVTTQWGKCSDMIRAGDHLVGVEDLWPAGGYLHVARVATPSQSTKHAVYYAFPKNVAVFPESERLGLAHMEEGLTLIPLEHLDAEEWSRELEDGFDHARFPASSCAPDDCESATVVAGFGPSAALVLACPDFPSIASPLLYLVTFFDPSAVEVRPPVAVTTFLDAPTFRQSLFVSGSLVFVALDEMETVEVFEVLCDP